MAEKIILVAMTEERLIGRGGALPWHLPAELRLFRQLTLGHPLIMGRHTFEAIGRPLPGRRNLVVSRTLAPAAGIEVCRRFEEALARAEEAERVFLIGGRGIFAAALPVADTLRISWVRGRYEGDVYFPEYDPGEWEMVEQHDEGEFRHVVSRRKGE